MSMVDNILKNELFEAFANASANIYIYVCDMKKDYSRWSQNTVKDFGMSGEYLENAGAQWMEKVHPDDRAAYLEDIDACFSGRSTRHSCQYRAKNIYNEYVWLECKGSVINDENGEPAVFAGLMMRLDNQNKYDPLTHLLTGFEMQNYDFSRQTGSLLFLGINDFRKINNVGGYQYGDKVLKFLAERLVQAAGKKDIVYRLQGDEFIVLSQDKTREDMLRLFETISDICGKRSTFPEGIRNFTLSGGIVSWPEDGANYRELLDNLSHSYEYARENRRGQAVAFSDQIIESYERNLRLQNALAESIKNDFCGFELYFQPILDSGTRRIIGCESLLRWKSAKIQDVAPYEFIRILESNGQIRDVGIWVMETALRHAAKWQKRFGDIYVSFNVSYLQLMDSEFVERLIESAKRSGVDVSRVMVELTESCQVEDIALLSQHFDRLRGMGFKIAMDDFGTEYATFGILHDVSMDVLKIDQKFVRGLLREGNITDLAIIESVVDMCRRLSIQTVAEGVETEEIQNMVQNIGVSYLQGFLYSRPVPEAEFERMLIEREIGA